MFEYFRNKKRLKQERERLKEVNDESDRIEVIMRLSIETADMTNKPCAINGFNNCSEKCVHFYKGKVIKNTFKGDGYFHRSPRCKLWQS